MHGARSGERAPELCQLPEQKDQHEYGRCPVAQRRPKRCGRDREVAISAAEGLCCCPGQRGECDGHCRHPQSRRVYHAARQPASIALFGRSAYRDARQGDNDGQQGPKAHSI